MPLGVQVGTSTMCLTYGIGDPTYPLISSLLNTATYRLTTQTLSATGPVKVLTQTMLGRSVTFWALNSSAIGPRQRATTADGAPLTTNIGLSTAISIGAGRGRPAIAGTPGPHGDPRTIPRLALGASAPSPGFEARVIMGVTTGDAHSVEVQLGGLTLHPILRTNPAFPGLSFFMFSDGPQDRIDTITVLSATNDVIAQADPTTIPNP